MSEVRTLKHISAHIRQKRYDGIDTTIRMFATRKRKLRKETSMNGKKDEKLERKWLVSLLYRPVDEVKATRQEQLDKVIDTYPIIGKIYDMVKGFKEILFSHKDSELDKGLEESSHLEVDEVGSFIKGIRRDIAAVKNAIRFEYNTELAEGSVNN